MEKGQKLEVGEHKFCPACGTKLKLTDTYCLRCGYSFAIRTEKNKNKKLNLRNSLIIIAILLLTYFGLRYSNGQTLFPTSFADAIKTLWPN